MSARVLMLDHADSFTFNLVDELARFGAEVTTLRSELPLASLVAAVREIAPALVVLSPGPGTPEEAHTTLAWLRGRPNVPVLGVCLGHQAIAVSLGGRVTRAPHPAHGRASEVCVSDDELFADLPRRFPGARYHSLVVSEVPAECTVIATARDGEHELVMAIRHRTLPWVGVQFHPESILTPFGSALLGRCLSLASAWSLR